jgi:ABC-type sulfate/molybdate transport systems ATPase subunit
VSDGDLAAAVVLDRGSLHLDVTLRAGVGTTVAVLGPNGAGKTTLLRALAGLLPIAEGTVRLGDTVLEDAAAGISLPPEDRPIGVVFQDYLLFPHLSALENVAFGLRSRGAGRARSRAAARHWLAEVGAEQFADRRPAQLSGGQAQRVAIARALAAEPRLLLLDEPFSALDAAARPLVRELLVRVLAERTALVISHDPGDAAALAEHVVVLEHGRVAAG